MDEHGLQVRSYHANHASAAAAVAAAASLHSTNVSSSTHNHGSGVGAVRPATTLSPFFIPQIMVNFWRGGVFSLSFCFAS